MISDPETSFHSDLRFENSITPHEKLVQKPGDSQTAQSAGTALSTWYLLPETGKTIFIKRHDEDDYIQYITTLKVQSSKCNIQLRRTAEDIKSSNISTFYPRAIHVLAIVPSSHPCRCEPWRPSSKVHDRVGQTSVIPPRSKKLNGSGWRIRWIIDM